MNTRRELYKTIPTNQLRLNQIKIYPLILRKRKHKIRSNCHEITNNQSILQTFGLKNFNKSTKDPPTLQANKTTEQTAFTKFIIVEDNITLWTEYDKNKKGTTRILLQNLNGLNSGNDGPTLHEIIDKYIKYDIYILCLPETNSNWKN